MNFNNFSDEIWERIQSTILELKKQNQPLIAAFDADGTLWREDLGEVFFQYQIQKKLVNLPEDPWNYYVNLKKTNNDPRMAYLWLAQICQGKTLSIVRQWAEAAVSELGSEDRWVLGPQARLISRLRSEGVKIFIVSASVTWAIEPGARRLGVPAENILAVETRVENSVIQPIQDKQITYREGKRDRLLGETAGVRPFLCCGNTLGDLHLLELATHISLAVSSAEKGTPLEKNESDLAEEAIRRGWFCHRF